MDSYINLGVGGAVVVFVLKEMFVFLKGNKDNGMATALKSISDALNNSTMLLELIQERDRTHEENAKTRNESLKELIESHGATCSKQAERVERLLTK